MNYELKLKDGKVVTWEGDNGEHAARRYVDCYQDSVVVATRPVPVGLFIYSSKVNVIE